MPGKAIMPDISYQTDARLITCVLPKGRARTLQEAIVDHWGIHTGTFHYARGVGRDVHIRDRGIGEQLERAGEEALALAEQLRLPDRAVRLHSPNRPGGENLNPAEECPVPKSTSAGKILPESDWIERLRGTERQNNGIEIVL